MRILPHAHVGADLQKWKAVVSRAQQLQRRSGVREAQVSSPLNPRPGGPFQTGGKYMSKGTCDVEVTP